jgi:ATP-dependent RNA helicase DeaD
VAITLAEPREHRMLKSIERVTKQRITIEKVPTVADLRTRRMEMTRATLEETLLEGGLEHFRVVVETLADEFDVMEVAMAAVKLAHEAGGAAADEEDIPEITPKSDKPRAKEVWDKKKPGSSGPSKGKSPKTGGLDAGTTRIFVGAGRTGGIRPQDLVGAIAGESHLSGRDIGAIEIGDRFSLVEIPSDAVDDVIAALKRTTIKGKKVNVRREKFDRK